MEKLNLVPQLRFSEFSEDWEEKIIKEIAPLQRGFDLPTANVVKGEYPVVYSNGILRMHNQYKVKAPGVVTGRSGTIGKVTYVEKDFWPHNTSLWITNFYDNNPKFIYYFYLIINLKKYSAGSTVPTLNRNDVHIVKKRIPNPTEQTKIATFLTAVDKRINLLQKKKTELEQYKKGVMQKLFSQTLRFKKEDGFDFEDWEEKKLGEVCEKKSSNISANTLKNNFGEYKIYGASGFLQNIDFYRQEEPYISIVKDGAGVGRTLLCEAKSSVLGTLDTIKPKDGNNLNFLYSLINQINFTKYITGSTIPHIYFRDYSKEKVSIPKPQEQQKIANFLLSIDKSIEKIANQIDNSVVFKKGLLQKMFV